MFRRISALLLCIVLIAGMLPVSAFAEEPAAGENSEINTTPQEPTVPAGSNEEVPPTTEPAQTEPQQTEPVLTESVIVDEAVNSTLETGNICGDNLTWTYADGTLTVTGSGRMSNFSSGATPWVDHIESITSVVIESGATSIGSYAFQDCVNLTATTIPATVASIGSFVFGGCTNLVEINLPASLTTIGISAFKDCTSLAGITIPETVTSIDMCAFQNCSSLTKVSLPEGLNSISSYAFMGCTNLNEITLPQSITSVGGCAFQNCSSLTEIIIPDGVTSILSDAFHGCSNLTKISLPQSVTSISSSAFRDCSSLTEITIPENITSIELSTFNGCSGLTKITLPQSVASIGNFAFSGCSALQSVELPANLTSIGTYSFNNCSSLKSISFPEGITSIPDSAFSNCTSLAAIAIPESVTAIGAKTFYNCTVLESVDLPANLTSISEQAFYNCTNLTGISIPDSVASIGKNAFYNCGGLSEIYIPAGVTTITADLYSDSPFFYCSSDLIIYCGADSAPSGWGPYWNYCDSITVLTTNYGVNWLDLTFWNSLDTSAESVLIPDGVTYIPDLAFQNFTNLKSVYIPVSVTEIQISGMYYESPFYGCSSDVVICCESVTAPDSWDTNWNNYSANAKLTVNYGWSTTDYNFWTTLDESAVTISIPNGVTAIPVNAFSNCSNLTSVFVPVSVTTFPTNTTNSPFWGCSSSIVVYCEALSNPSGSNASWQSCTSGTRVSVNYGWTRADYNYWLNLDRSQETIVIPDGVTLIPDSAFSGCTSLTSVTIADSVTSIGNYAFENCTGLTSLFIPGSVATTGYRLFDGCSSNLKIYCTAETEDTGWHGNWKGTLLTTPVYSTSRAEYNYWLTLDTSAEIIEIPSYVDNIPYDAFKDSTTLKSVTMPDSVTTIGASAFYGCASLAEVDFPASLHTIGDSAFYGCTSLAGIDFPASLRTINDSAFLGCTALTEVVIPSGTTYIGFYAFNGCTALETVFIPASVTDLKAGDNANAPFSHCDYSKLEIFCEAAVKPSGWGSYWSVGSQCTYMGCTKQSYDYWTTMDNSGEVIEIPAGVTFIPNNAFYGCTNLTKISIPDSVTSIGAAAFSNCTGLTEITLPEGLASIGSSAFSGCLALKSIEIPENVSYLGYYAFSECSSLTEVRIPEKITTIDSNTFSYCSSLNTIYIPASVTTIDLYAFFDCNNLTNIYFGHTADDELNIRDYVFRTDNTSHDIPTTVYVPTSRRINQTIFDCDWYNHTVTFVSTGNIPATGITLTEANNTTEIEAGLDLNFTAALTPADTTSELVWTATNGGIVKETDYASATATIIGTEAGTMTVRCESADDNSVFAEYEVAILEPTADVAAITVRSDTPYTNEVEVDTQAQMIADIYPGNAANKEVVWELENGTGTAELDENGLLTALTTGTVGVKAIATDGTNAKGSAVVNIVRYVDDLSLLFNGDPTRTTIGVGEPVMVTFEHFPEDATNTEVTWTLTDGTGSIQNSGYSSDYILICGETAGTATLTATAKDSKKTSVTVELEVVGEKASHPVAGGYIYYNTVTGAIVDADSTVTGANIPAKISDTTITSIAPRAFRHTDWWAENTTITSVTIPSTVTYIGEEAFSNCTALALLDLGSGVTTIEKEAFYNCNSLVNLTIPDSVTSVGYNAFYNLSSLKHLTMSGKLDLTDSMSAYYYPDSVTLTGETIISQPANELDEYIEIIMLPGRNAKNVIISDTVTTIEKYAFSSLGSIETVTIGSGVTSIGERAFSNCGSLTGVTMGDSVTRIDTAAFKYCYDLSSINLPDGLTHIGEEAFYSCDDLSSINLPDSLTYIGKEAFFSCGNLQLFDLSAVPDTITQQDSPLTANLVSIPDVLVSSTGGKVNLNWYSSQIDGETGEAGVYTSGGTNDHYLAIYKPGKVKLDCYDTYTGARGSKIINCELGLEIQGLWENYLTAGQSVTLTAIRADTNTEESVTWSLRPEDKAYASLSTTSGKSTRLTAKAVTKATDIQITATSNVSGEAPETRTIWILPVASGVIITDADGNVLGQTGTSVQTIKVDLRETASLQLFATTYPEGASTNVSWGSSNYAIADPYPQEGYIGDFDYKKPIVTLNSTGTATLTAYATDGSGKYATVKLEVYYLDPATKFTAKTNAPTTGLVDSHTAQIQIFGTDKNNPLDPTAFAYTLPVGQEEMAFVDENGMITAGSKAGTVTITATAKDDPKARKVTVKVKIIPAQTASILLAAEAEEPIQVVMLDVAGEITEDPALAAKYRVYLDKADVMGGKMTFRINPAITDTNGNTVTPTKSCLKWASTDTRVAAVAAGADGSATVTIPAKTDGACVITATSTDLAKVEGLLEVFVRDYSPRLESNTLTLNSNLTAGVSTGLTSSYGNEIKTVELTDPAAPFTVEHSDNLLTVTPTGVLKNGSYKLTLKVTCTEFGPFEITLTVKVANKLPTITVKQTGKFNLFYSDSTADLQITVKGEVIKDAVLAVTETSFETSSFNRFSGTMTVKFTPAYVAGTSGKLVNKVNLLVTLDGYREPISKTVSIATVTTKPTVSLTPASSIINTATVSEHSTTIQAYNKTAGTFVPIDPTNVTATFASVTSTENGIKLKLNEVAGKVNKGGSATILVQDTNWMQSIKLTHKVTVQTALPVVNLSAATLKLNRVFPAQSATANITLNQQNMAIGKIEIEPADKTEKLLTESRKISVESNGNTITAKLDQENLPANGNYSYRVTVTLADGTPLAAKTFKVNVNSTVPTVKLKTATLKLNKVLGTEYAAASSAFVLTKGDGYEIAGFKLPNGWSNQDIAVEYKDGCVYTRLLRTENTATKHTVALTPILRHIATDECAELPTTVKLTVQLESKPLSVNVAAAGKLDATLPGSAITYTVKSFTNVFGTPSAVKLEGTHGELFDAALDTSGSSPVATLKMRSDLKYDLKTTYKVDLVFTICGQPVRKSVTFKISQSALKFATVKTVNLYQFQSQAVTTTIKVTAPAGAAIDQIALSSKSALQFRRALGNGSMKVTLIGDGSSALVSFTLENPGYLSYGKSYAVCLDVTPVTTANTVKPTQVKLTVKSFK